MKTRLFILLLTPILYVASGSSRPWYTGESPLRQAEYQKEKLTDCNLCADSDVVNVTSTGIHPGEGARPSICLDLANRHNRAGKKYAVYRADSTGKAVRTGSVEKPVWGVVWGYRDPQNHHALLLRGGADDFYGYQPPELQFSIITVADGDTVFRVRYALFQARFPQILVHITLYDGKERLLFVFMRGGAAFQPVLAVGGAALFLVQTENNAEALVPDIAVRGTGGCQTEGGIRRSGGVAQSQKQRKRQHEP